mgnify:CR=1 FL=1
MESNRERKRSDGKKCDHYDNECRIVPSPLVLGLCGQINKWMERSIEREIDR